MPRDIGSGLYHYPEGTPGNPGQTVFSARYNTFINDLSNTLNQKLPVNMGGTGADNASEARDNIDAEVSGAQVTNYNNHAFENGSFWSVAGATGSPDIAKPFWGFAYGIDANNINITVRNGQYLYNRIKHQGAWGTWTDSVTTAGDLVIDKINPAIWLAKKASGQQNLIHGLTGDKARWVITPGDASPETGGNTGSNFSLYCYDDAGNYSGNPLMIDRSNGGISLTGNVYQKNGKFWVQNAVPDTAQGTIYFGNSMAQYFWFNGTDFQLGGGHLVLAGGKGINCYSAQITTLVNCASVSASSSIYGAAITCGTLASTSYVAAKSIMYIDGVSSTNSPGLYFRDENGVEHGYVFWDRTLDEMVMQYYTATKIRVGNTWMASSTDTAYKPSGGAWIAGSDARIKTVVGDYAHGLTEVLALHPVRYTYKGNDVFGKALPPDAKDAKDASLHSSVVGKEFIGLVAQECEGAMPEMVAKVPGFIDGQAVTDLRTLDTGPLMFALVNAVKELTARIATLEAAQVTP